MRRLAAPLMFLAWLGAAVLAIWLFLGERQRAGRLVGIAQPVDHEIGTLESGRIGRLLVAVGDQVASGATVAEFATADLEQELQGLTRDAEVLSRLAQEEESAAAAAAVRRGAERAAAIAAAEDRVAAIQATLDSATTSLETHRAEVAALGRELERLTAQAAAGVSRADEAGRLTIERDRLASSITGELRALAHQERRLAQATAALVEAQAVSPSAVAVGEPAPSRRRLAELESKRRELAATLARCRFTAPCAGTVIALRAQPGDVVSAGGRLLTIREAGIAALDAWLPEQLSAPLDPGRTVVVFAVGSDLPVARGRIELLHPGFTTIPGGLLPATGTVLGRQVRIRLDDPKALLPGQRVQIEVEGRAGGPGDRTAWLPSLLPAAGATEMLPPPTASAPRIHPFQVPPELAQRSAVEASAAWWWPARERLLVVSDDTGHGAEERAPWLFTADRQGHVDAAPVAVAGAGPFNDLESLAALPDLPQAEGGGPRLLLLSSLSRSRHGKRPDSRTRLHEIAWQDGAWRERRSVSLAALLNHLPAGFTADDLDLEGLLVADGALVVGLKAPADPTHPGHGTLWNLGPWEALLAGATPTVTPWATIDLTALAEAAAPARVFGISDLLRLPDGRLLATVSDPTGPGGALVVTTAALPVGHAPGELATALLARWTDRTPEGLALLPGGPGATVAVLFDGGEKPSALCELTVPAP